MHPLDVKAMYKKADMHYEKGDYEKAQLIYSQLINSPELSAASVEFMTEILLKGVSCLVEIGDVDQAEAIIASIDSSQLHKSSTEFYSVLMAKMAMKRGDFQRGWLFLSEQIERLPLEKWDKANRLFYFSFLSYASYQYGLLWEEAQTILQEDVLLVRQVEILKQILMAIEKKLFVVEANPSYTQDIEAKICTKLAYYYLQQGNFSDLEQLATTAIEKWHDKEAMQLLVLAATINNQHKRALEILESFKNRCKDHELREITYLQGEIYENLGDYVTARSLFESVIEYAFVDEITSLAKLKLLGIYEQISDTTQQSFALKALPSEEQLHKLPPIFSSYYRAERAYIMGNYEEAASLYENAISQQGYTPTRLFSLYEHMGWTQFFLDEAFLSLPDRLAHLKAAERAFSAISDRFSKQAASPGLIYVYASLFAMTKDNNYKSMAMELISKGSVAEFDKSLLYLILFPQEAVNSTFVENIEQGRYRYHDRYLYAVYRSSNWLALQAQTTKDVLQARKLHQRASDMFYFSYIKLRGKRNMQAALNLQMSAISDYHTYNQEYYQNGLHKLSILFELLGNKKDQKVEELFYLEGAMAYGLVEKWGQGEFVDRALAAFSRLFSSDKYSENARFYSAKLFYGLGKYADAEENFAFIAEHFPHSTLAGDSLNWAADSARKGKRNSSVIEGYLKTLFTKYPTSSMAAKAYYDYYLDARKGPNEKDLENFIQQFSHSYLVIEVFNRLGKHNMLDPSNIADLKKAYIYFERAINHPLDDAHPCFLDRLDAKLGRCKAALELANHHNKADKLVYYHEAVNILVPLLDEYDKLSDDDKNCLYGTTDLPIIIQDSEITLAKAYMGLGEDAKALYLLSHLIRYTTHHKIPNDLQQKVWDISGALALKNHDYGNALHCFCMADNAKPNPLASDFNTWQRWLYQSQCYIKLEQYDEALLLLSKLINESRPSEISVEAMFLRAEVYQATRQDTLAFRQFQEVSLLEGKWAQKARALLK